MNNRQQQIAEASIQAADANRAAAAEELAFVRNVWARLPEGSRVRDHYAELAARLVVTIEEIGAERAALTAVRDELAAAQLVTTTPPEERAPEPAAVAATTNGGRS